MPALKYKDPVTGNWVLLGGAPPTGASFRFVQATASATWTINHGLSFWPNVEVVDTLGREIFPEVTYASASQVVLSFSPPAAGEAYLS